MLHIGPISHTLGSVNIWSKGSLAFTVNRKLDRLFNVAMSFVNSEYTVFSRLISNSQLRQYSAIQARLDCNFTLCWAIVLFVPWTHVMRPSANYTFPTSISVSRSLIQHRKSVQHRADPCGRPYSIVIRSDRSVPTLVLIIQASRKSVGHRYMFLHTPIWRSFNINLDLHTL